VLFESAPFLFLAFLLLQSKRILAEIRQVKETRRGLKNVGCIFWRSTWERKMSDTVKAQFEVDSLDDIIIGRKIVSFQVCFMQEEMSWETPPARSFSDVVL